MTQAHPSTNRTCRRARPVRLDGFSLLELLLVLAIMVAALAIAAPTYESIAVERRLQHSVDTLQVELHKARVKALRTGQAQVLRYQIDGSGYNIQPWLSAGDDVNASAGATILSQTGQAIETSSTGTANLTDAKSFEKSLEDGIFFAGSSVAADSRTVTTQVQSGILSGAGGLSDPIMFYSDGSTTTTEIIVQDPKGRRRSLQLRGLTGECRVIELTSVSS
jgi:prepilin-type N-terminal cleavage/methylation domain-containing protein